MNIFEFAMQKERDAENFYRDLAGKAKSPGLRKIFNMLADAEIRHFEVVRHMQESAPDVPPATILDDAVATFREMRRNKDYDVGYEERQVEVYEKARAMEKESCDFYTQQAEETDDETSAEIFRQLAGQESMHYRLVDHLAEFVIRPRLWFENGEYSHIIDQDRGTAFYPEKP